MGRQRTVKGKNGRPHLTNRGRLRRLAQPLEIPSRPRAKATRPTPGQASSGGQLPFLHRTRLLEVLAGNFCGPPYNYFRLQMLLLRPGRQEGVCVKKLWAKQLVLLLSLAVLIGQSG